MAETIRQHAIDDPDRIAIVDEHGEMTWAELDAMVNRWINASRASGIETGDTVSLLCGNRAENAAALLAAAHGGWRMVPVNWHWTAEELAYVLEDSGSKALFADHRFADIAREGVQRMAGDLVVATMIGGPAPEGFVAHDEWLGSASAEEPDDQHFGGPMFYTSGTTGFPKGVRSTLLTPDLPADMGAFLFKAIAEGLQLPADGATLLCGPLYHSAQWAWSLPPLAMGAKLVMQHKFDPVGVLELVQEHRITNIHLVPTQFIRLLKVPETDRAEFDLSSLQIIWHGAAPCSPQVKRSMIDWLGPIVSEYYGGTEGGIISGLTAEEWLERPGSVGVPGDGYEVKILDEDGGEVPTGESGQIWFKQLSGQDFEYHNAPEKTAAAHREGGFGTLGDIGYFDEDGYLYLSDRKIDMIISGGVNIYPAEIEGVLVTHSAVKDAAVFGIPDDEMGEEVKAAVELVDGHEPSPELEKQLIAHVRDHLAGYKAPKSVDFEEEFPRHPTGKLYKRLLRDPYWEGAGRSM